MTSLDLNLLTNTLITFFQNNAHLLPNYVPDSSKVSILLWSVKNQPNTFMLKIADQKYISDCRVDKNGETYWKFKEVEESEIIKTNDPSPTPPSAELDPIAKFQSRQVKTEQLNNYAKPNNEQSVNNS